MRCAKKYLAFTESARITRQSTNRSASRRLDHCASFASSPPRSLAHPALNCRVCWLNIATTSPGMRAAVIVAETDHVGRRERRPELLDVRDKTDQTKAKPPESVLTTHAAVTFGGRHLAAASPARGVPASERLARVRIKARDARTGERGLDDAVARCGGRSRIRRRRSRGYRLAEGRFRFAGSSSGLQTIC